MIFNFIKKKVAKIVENRTKKVFDIELNTHRELRTFKPHRHSPGKTYIEAEKSIPPLNLKDALFLGTRIKPFIDRSLHQIIAAVKTLNQNPRNPKTKASPEFIEQIEKEARRLGADEIGWTTLTPDLIFKEYPVYSPNVIVLLKEMNKEKINRAPSNAALHTIFRSYAELGRIVNQLTGFLRENGYGAQGGTALSGMALYPPTAEKAGLGRHGLHGLLITEKFGPRIRIGLVYTGIENLPVFTGENPHSWIEKFCRRCRICIKRCPGAAILEEPIKKNNSLTHIVKEKCLPHFYNEHGCSVCIKVCPFNNIPYAELKKSIQA
ncbi:MAG: [Fe-S]-binding protein [Candidatus Aminicenantes bacterium]|nr:[Fe-S]-binding protein [Candidatus Aminicenantes bacterium]